MEMMIDVSSDISQLITSYPIDSLPRYPALFSFNKWILSPAVLPPTHLLFSCFCFIEYLKQIPKSFPFYNLYSTTHILNSMVSEDKFFRKCHTSKLPCSLPAGVITAVIARKETEMGSYWKRTLTKSSQELRESLRSFSKEMMFLHTHITKAITSYSLKS